MNAADADTGTSLGDEADTRAVWIALCDLVFENVRRREASAAAGVSFGKVRALRRLLGGAVPIGELATSLSIDAPNATVLVDELEGDGLVRRREHPADRRTRLVELTATGRRRAAKAERVLSDPPAALAALSSGELALLAAVLRRVGAGGRRARASGNPT